MAEQISVLIADDHPIVRQGMEMLLDIQDDIAVIGVVENGQEAVDFVETQPPDVVLMDLNMPLLNGIDATKKIRVISPHTKVIVLTSHHQDAMVFPSIKAGALSYLLKSAKPNEVVEAIRAAGQLQQPRRSHRDVRGCLCRRWSYRSWGVTKSFSK